MRDNRSEWTLGSIVDIRFAVRGAAIPLDHSFALYSAISRALPSLHGVDWLAIHSLDGKPLGRTLRLDRRSSLRLRVPAERIASVLPLAGRGLDVAGALLQIGVPNIQPVVPSPSLDARLVCVKLTVPPRDESGRLDVPAMRLRVQEQLARQLEAMEVRAEVSVGGSRGVQIHGRTVFGFSVRLAGLSGSDSMRVQALGLGGKRAMGCGVFRPARETER
jgi:CRISPR-associated endonuclease/helicase Cas3